MDKTYFLEQKTICPRLSVPITEEEFSALAGARRVLSESLEFEQRYELLVGNFISMELAFTELCLRSAVERSYAYPDLAKVIQEANRHIVNILTAARSYIDQVKQDFKFLPLDPEFLVSANLLFNKEYDGSLFYRFMEALRNYTQHRAFPATNFSDSSLDHESSGWAEKLTIQAVKEQLFLDKKFKRKFLEDLPEKIDLRHASREYVRGLGNVHIALRALVQQKVIEARELVDKTIKIYRDAGASSNTALCARKFGDEPQDVPVMNDWDDVRAKLAAKNGRSIDLWPRRRGGEPSGADLQELRARAKHTVAQAARIVDLPLEQWEKYEAGLRIPASVHVYYLLQTNQHPTHDVICRPNSPDK